MRLAIPGRSYRTPGPAQVERLNKGISASVIRQLAGTLDIPARVLANSIGLSERTIRSRVNGPEGKWVHTRVRLLDPMNPDPGLAGPDCC
jgi:hypothetical protein